MQDKNVASHKIFPLFFYRATHISTRSQWVLPVLLTGGRDGTGL